VQRRCVYEVGSRQVHEELKEVLTASRCWHAVPDSSTGTLAARGRPAIAPWSDATEREKHVLVKSKDHQAGHPKWQFRGSSKEGQAEPVRQACFNKEGGWHSLPELQSGGDGIPSCSVLRCVAMYSRAANYDKHI